MRRDVEFKSKGDTIRGTLITPDKGRGPYPTVIMAGGWCYVKEIVMPHYAEFIVKSGIAVLLFDYRRFGASEGEPRQHINPWDEIDDYTNAISFAETQPEVDKDRIGVWGISYSGGHVIVIAATDPRVKAVVSNIPVVDGYTNMRRVQGELRFQQLVKNITEDRRKRFANPKDRAYIPMSTPDNKEISTWPFPDVYEIFAKIKKAEAPRHEHFSTLESVELLLNYNIYPFCERIYNTPTLMIVAENDEKTLWDLEIKAYNTIAAANKKLIVLPHVSHMSLYSQKSHLQVAGDAAGEWFARHLMGAPELAATHA